MNQPRYFFTLVLCILVLIATISLAHAQHSSPIIDGSIGANEYGDHTDGNNAKASGGQTWYMTWDDANLYVALANANLAEGAVLYIDHNPIAPANGGTNANGNLAGQAHDNTNFTNLPFRADFVAYFKDGYREHRAADGAGNWGSATTGFGSYASSGTGNVRELSIPWSAVTGSGRPAAFNFFIYATSGGGFVYGQAPTENASGNIGTSATYRQYYKVWDTDNVTSTKPFSVNSSDASVGGTGATYATLKAAFDAVNAGTHKANVNLYVTGNTTESTAAVLCASGLNWNGSSCVAGSSSYARVLVQPSGGSWTISGNLNGSLVRLDGADNVTIDGRQGGAGATLDLTIDNTSTGTSATTLRLINDATNNTVRYVTIRSASTGSSSGALFFSTASSGAGNDDNTIDHCHIRDSASGTPRYAIYSDGTSSKENSGNTISNNDIYNWSSSGASYGIYLYDNNTAWTITGNSFYQTTSRSTGDFAAIYIEDGSGYTISNNCIGGQEASCGGSPMTLSSATFRGIRLTVGASPATEVQGNTIRNVSATLATGSSSDYGIGVRSGTVNIGNVAPNVIGSQDGTGSLSFTMTGGGSTVYGIVVANSGGTLGNSVISNNSIGGISVSGGVTAHLQGIGNEDTSTTGGATSTISGNTIGSTTVANSMQNATASGTTYGIYRETGTTPTTISNNTIASVTSAYSLYGVYSASRDASGASAISGNVIDKLTGTGTASYQVIGILTDPGFNNPGLFTISGNTVIDLSSASQISNSGSGAVIGISQRANSTGGQTVAQNTIHSLASTATTPVTGGAVLVSGIFYYGPATGTNLVARNFVHSLNAGSTTTSAAINGILAYGGATTYQNNMVRVGIDKDGNSITTGYATSGIYHYSGASTFYHNTLWVGGEGVTTSTSHTAALNTQTINARIVKDNILVNARSNATGTGTHAAALFSSTSGLTSNYNLFYASGTGWALVRTGSTNYTTLSAWQSASTQDANSLVPASGAQINLVNPTGNSAVVDLHVQSPTAIEGAGVDVGVIDDYDGDARSSLTPTDIGADAGAFAAVDTTPPAFDLSAAQLPNLVVSTLGNVIITDAGTGVATDPVTRPRVYYKRTTDGNTVNDNTCTTDGWKYVVSDGSGGSPFSFTLDYSLLFGCNGVDAATVIQYFVVAQDQALPPNVGSSSGSFASQPTSVALTPGAFPVGGTPSSTPAPYIWQGDDVNDPTNWHVAANWDSNLVPTSHNAAVIPLATNKPIVKQPGFTAEAAYLTVQGSGALTIDPGFTLNISRKLVNYGQIKGAGTAIVQDMDWHDGYLDTVQLTVTRALVIKSNQWRFLRAGAVLTIASTATATWEGTGSISAFSVDTCTTDCTRIENHGVWEIPIDATMSSTYSAGTNSRPATFHNATNPSAPHGLLKRTTSAGVASLQVCFDNDGVVEVHSGTLELDGRCDDTNTSDGAFLVKTAATLWLTKSAAVPYSQRIGASGVIQDFSPADQGNVRFEYGATVVDGEYNIHGSTTAQSNSSSIHTLNKITSLGFVNLPANNNASLTLNGVGKTFDHLYDIENHSGGVLTVNFDIFNVGTLASPKNYTQSCSHGLCTWAGTGIAQVWGTTTWLDGTISGIDRATDKFVANGPVVIDNATWKYLKYRAFETNAGLTFMNGSIRATTGTIHNGATGTWDFQCDCDIFEYLNIDSFFLNDGTVQKTGGTVGDTTEIDAYFINNKKIDVQAGYLDLTGGGESPTPATIRVSAGSTLGLLAVQTGEHTWNISGPLCADPPACAATNSGKVEVHDSGIVTISGTYHAAQGTTVSDCVGGGFTRATLNFDVVPLAMGDLTLEGVVTANFNTGSTITPDDVLLVNRTDCNPNNNDGRQPRLDINTGASLTVNGAYQQVAESATYPNLYFAARGGNGHLILNGPSIWSAGTWGDEWYPPTTYGTTTANNTLDIELNNGHLYMWGHTLNVGATGIVTIHGAGADVGILSAYYGSAINNQGTITLADDRTINGYLLYDPQTVLNNRGSFRKISGAGTSGLAAHVNNWGTFAVDSGTLWLGDFDSGSPNNNLLFDLVNKGPADGEPASGQVLIAAGAQLNVQGFVTNNGKIQQTQSEQAGGGFARQFAMIQDNAGNAIRYRGVDVVPTSGRMETTTVAVWGNQHCGTAIPSVASHPFGGTGKNASHTVLRCYEVTPTTPQAADITFYYLSNDATTPPSHWPNERNGNSDPHAWHHNATVNPQRWDLETRGTKDNTTNGYRYVQATGVDQYSPFALLDSSPLAVTLADFSAAQVNDYILVTWETVSELNNRGFNLYRGTSEVGPDIQLNETLIPSQSQGNPVGFIYTWEDRRDLVPGTTYYYWLEDVDLNGTVTRHGPVTATYQQPTAVALSDLQAGGESKAGLAPAWAVALAALALAVAVGVKKRSRA